MKNFVHNRLWEILPGLSAWLTIVLLFYSAFYFPVALAVAVIIYASYWLLKIAVITYHLIDGYRNYRNQIGYDWMAKLEREFPEHKKLIHLAIIPSYKEDISILRSTLDSIDQCSIDNSQVIAVIAFEQRDTDLAPKYAPMLKKEYGKKFKDFIVTFHPSDIPGEVRGKGPNITYSARQLKEYLDDKKISYDDVIVTTLDADNRVDTQYFANLSYAFLSDYDPHHKSFQPIPLFFNNVWKIPLPVRLISLGDSYWNMIQAVRPHLMRNFSAHSQSFAALVKTDFWSVTTVVEDGHQYWRSYFAFDGNHHVIPIFTPIYMDSVQGENFFDTMRELYLQRRRWYWGASDIPYVWKNCLTNKRAPFFAKWSRFIRLVEGHYSLATQSFILAFGTVPVFVNYGFRETVVGFTFPIIYQYILTGAWIGIISNIFISASLLPAKSPRRRVHWGTLLVQWILTPVVVPITAMFFAAIPALDSQTRMLLNKPFTVFNVTKKQAVEGGTLRVSEN